jgi:hypothetical protein
MGMKYDKWTTLETHVDDKTESSYTKGFVVGYRLVQLTDGKQIRSDKQAKHGTTVKGIVKRSGSQPALFIIKEGKVTSNDEITGEYEMIGVGLRLQTVTLINSRNAEREQAQIDDNTDFTIDVRDDTQHNISNCTVTPAMGQLVYSGGGNVPEFNIGSTHVFHGGARMILGTDYTETPGSGKINAITFTPDTTTVVDCDRTVNATAPAAITYEKVP